MLGVHLLLPPPPFFSLVAVFRTGLPDLPQVNVPNAKMQGSPGHFNAIRERYHQSVTSVASNAFLACATYLKVVPHCANTFSVKSTGIVPQSSDISLYEAKFCENVLLARTKLSFLSHHLLYRMHLRYNNYLTKKGFLTHIPCS